MGFQDRGTPFAIAVARAVVVTVASEGGMQSRGRLRYHGRDVHRLRYLARHAEAIYGPVELETNGAGREPALPW